MDCRAIHIGFYLINELPVVRSSMHSHTPHIQNVLVQDRCVCSALPSENMIHVSSHINITEAIICDK